MNAAFAFLADTDTHNLVRRLAWELHRTYQTSLRACRLPPHISIKQPFAMTELVAVERYFDELAHSLSPFEVTLSELQVITTLTGEAVFGIVWLEVEETPFLRQLHERVNHDLARRFENTQAPFDGADYHFHMTVAISEQPGEVYSQIEATFATRRFELRYCVREMGMFVYDDDSESETDYMMYKIAPLAGERIDV